MKPALPVVVLCTVFLGGAAFAQSFEPPSIPEIPQIDPPSLEISVGPSDDDIQDLQDAVEDAARSVAQQGRAILDSDFGISPDEPNLEKLEEELEELEEELSNLAKMLHDTALAIIRKIGG